jgi:hypothetical protein
LKKQAIKELDAIKNEISDEVIIKYTQKLLNLYLKSDKFITKEMIENAK